MSTTEMMALLLSNVNNKASAGFRTAMAAIDP
jgi:hypothetical protein